jgi:chromosome segregation ATPase
MSAYAKGPGSQVISFTPPVSHSPPQSHQNPETFDHLPSLPQIAGELESYFNIARQIEAHLIQERSLARKYRDELRDLHGKYSRLTAESESRGRDIALREERIKQQLGAFQKNDQLLRQQIHEQAQQIGSFYEDRKKFDLDHELLKSTLENYKNREESLKRSLQSAQANDKFRTDREERLKKELQTVQFELQRYKAEWNKVAAMDQKARHVIDDSYESQRKVEELTAMLDHERRRREDSDESAKKENREKQIALSCLHAAESRIAQISHELENLRDRVGSSFEGTCLELKF